MIVPFVAFPHKPLLLYKRYYSAYQQWDKIWWCVRFSYFPNVISTLIWDDQHGGGRYGLLRRDTHEITPSLHTGNSELYNLHYFLFSAIKTENPATFSLTVKSSSYLEDYPVLPAAGEIIAFGKIYKNSDFSDVTVIKDPYAPYQPTRYHTEFTVTNVEITAGGHVYLDGEDAGLWGKYGKVEP